MGRLIGKEGPSHEVATRARATASLDKMPTVCGAGKLLNASFKVRPRGLGIKIDACKDLHNSKYYAVSNRTDRAGIDWAMCSYFSQKTDEGVALRFAG